MLLGGKSPRAKNRFLSTEKKDMEKLRFQSLAPGGRHAPCAPKQHLFEGASLELKRGARPVLHMRLCLSAPQVHL